MKRIEMTNQEAICRLINHFNIHDDGRPTPYLDEAVRLAIKALEKQTPTKPNWIYDDEPLCPYCQEVIEDGDVICDSCHQLIDWSE